MSPSLSGAVPVHRHCPYAVLQAAISTTPETFGAVSIVGGTVAVGVLFWPVISIHILVPINVSVLYCFFCCSCDGFVPPPPTEAGAIFPRSMGTPVYLPQECLVFENVTCHASQDVFGVAVLLLLVCVRSPMMRSNMFCHEVRVWCSHTCSALLYVFAVGNESCYLLSPY